MSFEATAWAWQQEPASSTQKLLLLALADCRNEATGQCNPSHATLASKCQMSPAAVRKNLPGLEKDGFITVLRSTKDGKKQSNQYRLNFTPSHRQRRSVLNAGVGNDVSSIGNDVTYHRQPRSVPIGNDVAINLEEEPRTESINEPAQKEVSEEVKQARITMLQNLKQTLASKRLPLTVMFDEPQE